MLRVASSTLGLGLLLLASCGEDPATGPVEHDGGATSSGGSSGNVVPVGGACSSDDACEGRCVGGSCAPPTVTDGKRSPSLGETDVDCGGGAAPTCPLGKACVAD